MLFHGFIKFSSKLYSFILWSTLDLLWILKQLEIPNLTQLVLLKVPIV